MKPKISVYLTAAELVQLKKAAQRERMSLSRYAKERLLPDPNEGEAHQPPPAFNGELAAAWREQLGETVRKTIVPRTDELKENLHTVMAMLDQLVLSTLTHLPEIPPALEKERVAAGAQRHRVWQQQVAEELRKLRVEINQARRFAHDHPASADAGTEA